MLNREIMQQIRVFEKLDKDDLISLLINKDIEKNDLEKQYKEKISDLNQNIIELLSTIDTLKGDIKEFKEYHQQQIQNKNNDIDLLIDNNNYWMSEHNKQKEEIKRLNGVIQDIDNLYSDDDLDLDLDLDLEY